MVWSELIDSGLETQKGFGKFWFYNPKSNISSSSRPVGVAALSDWRWDAAACQLCVSGWEGKKEGTRGRPDGRAAVQDAASQHHLVLFIKAIWLK